MIFLSHAYGEQHISKIKNKHITISLRLNRRSEMIFQ